MADVRALLRQERASRQQAELSQRKPSAAPSAGPKSKKRKAADDGTEERKRTRTEVARGIPTGFSNKSTVGSGNAGLSLGGPDTPADYDEPLKPQPPALRPGTEAVATTTMKPPQLEAADLEDMDAFLREVDAPRAQNTASIYASGAVVEAAPMTAAEVAAQAREEQSAQRGKREEELEAEKEDAARQMEDEFEEMEGLEERVRKLREKREALRVNTKPDIVVLPSPSADNEEEGSDSDDEEDWDDWEFHPA